MSSCHAIIANLDKKQYVDPDAFNDNYDYKYLLMGDHARAVAVLVCQGGPGAGSGSRLWEQFAGFWSGNRVVGVYDTGEPPNDRTSYGVHTATSEDPDRNLFGMVWQEFEDISYPMLVLLCEADREFAGVLLSRTVPHDFHSLWHFGNAMKVYPNNIGSTRLMEAVASRFGPDWERLYQEQAIREQELAEE